MAKDTFWQINGILLQIKKAMFYKDVTQKDIAKNTEINLRTLSRRFKEPSKFTIDELLKITDFLDMKMEIKYERNKD